MAAPVVTNTNNRRDGAEATTNWSKEGGAGAPQQESDFVYSGNFSVSSKVSNTSDGGHRFDDPTAQDMTVAGDNVVLMKSIWTNFGVLTTPTAASGAEHRIGSDTSNYNGYFIADGGQRGDLDYPILGGWIISPIDPNVTEWADEIIGTPVLTAIDYYATWGGFSASSKSENVATDAVDLSPGLFQVDGIGVIQSARARWERFEFHDAQTTANRFGHIVLQNGVYNCYGKFVIGRNASGTVTATAWYDANQTVVFLGGRVDEGWNGIEVDLGNASTVVEFVNCVHNGLGRRPEKAIFHTTKDVLGGDDQVVLDADGQGGGDWNQTGSPATAYIGWYVDYSRLNGGTQNIGLTPGTSYYIQSGDGPDQIAFVTVKTNAYLATGTGAANLTAGANEEHQLQLGPCNLPVLDVTGTSGTFGATLCTFQQFNTMDLTSACTFDGCIFVNCWRITAGGATFDGCTFENEYFVRGDVQLSTTDPGAISNCTFTSSPLGGHAVQCATAGTYSFNDNVFVGYGPAAQSFDTETDINQGTPDTITITGHPYSTGDPVAYNKEGGTENTNLIDGRFYYLRSRDANTVSVHPTKADANDDTAAISLNTSGAGQGETHTFYSSDAAFVNASGGTITLNVSGGSGLTVRNGTGSTTIVNNTVNVTLTGLVNNTEVRVYDQSGNELQGQENVTTGTYVISLDAATVVDIRIFAVSYLPADILDYTIPSTATSIPIQQIFDRNYSNP